MSNNEEGNENKIHAVLEILSMETMQEMPKDPNMIKIRENAGVIVKTQKMIKLVE